MAEIINIRFWLRRGFIPSVKVFRTIDSAYRKKRGWRLTLGKRDRIIFQRLRFEDWY